MPSSKMAIQFPESSTVPLSPLSPNRTSDLSQLSMTSSSSVKIGGLWKRSQGVSRFTKPNYKHRVFILTDQALSYYGGTVDRVGQMKGRVPLDLVRAVEFVDVSAFGLAHTMQVVYASKKSGFVTLYIIATTKEECSDWVATLRQACYFNRDMLMHYHPGAFVRGKWTCCIQHARTTLGCQPTYHLLTRSSSRYAQMRRKDTLTSSGHSQRRARPGSRGSRTLSDRDRRSTATMTLTEGDDAPLSGHVTNNPTPSTTGTTTGVQSATQGVLGPGGLSNSYMELSMHPPHPQDMFTLSSPPSNSRRSSKNSTEQSIGMGSMVLTRLSLSEVADSSSSQIAEEERENETLQSHSQPITRCLRSERGEVGKKKGGGRSQVAPTWPAGTPMVSGGELPLYRHSYEMEHSTLPRSFKTRTPGLSNSWNHTPPRVNRGEERAQGERAGPMGGVHVEPHPVPPPRTKKGIGHTQLASSCASSSSSATNVMSHASQALPPNPSPLRNGMKHSKTFMGHPHYHLAEVRGHLQSTGYSQSMGALSKPLIEPKVSISNPNVIHV